MSGKLKRAAWCVGVETSVLVRVSGMKKILVTFFVIVLAQPVVADTDAWVTTDRLARRTCPSDEGGIVGYLFFREKAIVLEQRNGWGRISDSYYASCRGGISQFVDSGNAACTESNGIVQGRFAEWIVMRGLSTTRPSDPSTGATGPFALVAQSDDYRIYKNQFAKAASELIASGRCTEQDFRNGGGWSKSTNHNGPIYFAYCGGMHISNRLYLNAATGDIFK